MWKCLNQATHYLIWTEPMHCCQNCGDWILQVGDAMGFYVPLHTYRELEEEERWLPIWAEEIKMAAHEDNLWKIGEKVLIAQDDYCDEWVVTHLDGKLVTVRHGEDETRIETVHHYGIILS